MKLIIKKSKLIMFLLLFTFIEPAYFQIKPTLHLIYRVSEILSTGILMLYYFNNKIKPSKIVVLLFSMLIGMFISCKLGQGSIASTIAAYLPYVGIAMWIDFWIKVNVKDTFDVLVNLLDVLVFINLVTFILFPKGLFISQSFQSSPYVCWFLGYKNPQIRILLPYIALIFVRDNIKYKKIKMLSYFKLLTLCWITLKLKSTTGLVGLVLFLVLTFIFKNSNTSKFKYYLLKLLNIKVIYILMIVLNILIIFFNFQNNFSYFIVNVLHKDVDLTDRIYIWKAVILHIKDHFWMGEGVFEAEVSKNLVRASHAHNYFLNTLYNGGLLAFFLICIIWLEVGKESKKYLYNFNIRILVFMSIVFLVMGITESLISTILLYPILVLAYDAKYIIEYEKEVERVKDENI